MGPIRALAADILEAERQRCLRIVREQPFYPDTISGRRQKWVKDSIEAKILGREPPPAEPMPDRTRQLEEAVTAEREGCAALAKVYAERFREKCEAEFHKASRGDSDAVMYRVYGGAADAAQEVAEALRARGRANASDG